jgi:catechol 2,3-dioxygenase
VAVNTWRGEGVPPAPPDAVGLLHWTIEVDTLDQVEQVASRVEAGGHPVERSVEGVVVRDPWNIALLLRAGSLQNDS